MIGDERLCRVLSDYLEDIEQGEIELQYAEVLQDGMAKDTDIICAVYLWFGPEAYAKKTEFLGKYTLSRSYTEYFSRPQVFVNINQYRSKGNDKYFRC